METWVDAIALWLRGVIPSITSTLGIIFNIISFLVLRKCEGNEVFKQLLMSLGISKKIDELKKTITNYIPNYFQLALIASTSLISFVTI